MGVVTISLGILGVFTAPDAPKPHQDNSTAGDISAEGLQMSPSQLFRLTDFWLLVGIIFILTGSGATAIVNLGSMVISAGGKNGEQNILIFYLSLANCGGRLLFGYLSDHYAHKVSKVEFLGVVSVVMALSQVGSKSPLSRVLTVPLSSSF
jgi:hypothetical protein